MLTELGISQGSVEEVREIQTALGIVAAGVSLCVIPAASQRQRPDDVCYRTIKHENATSRIICDRAAQTGGRSGQEDGGCATRPSRQRKNEGG
ncbi:hypothetical protein [Sinorhizobium terangae]|uniref:hypothetical protein n=1 Tax=Sinorhizobium terangae TaxID=110322 RepID=UPI0018221A4D|nr:hypothetical protein [Sinorhizobium terangae]MBB4188867.1 hypothetical protein [Sinorhizobium terangae]WFU51229.1 hypothetical protein QA637_21855 [Sinorhizobium terangae]